MEVGDHAVSHREGVRREDELVGPAVERLDFTINRLGGLQGFHGGGADGKHIVVPLVSRIDQVAAFLVHIHLFRVTLMFGEVLHFDVAEVAHARMQGEFGERGSDDFEAFHEDLAEMQACGRG